MFCTVEALKRAVTGVCSVVAEEDEGIVRWAHQAATRTRKMETKIMERVERKEK
jgi:hypothetical protein